MQTRQVSRDRLTPLMTILASICPPPHSIASSHALLINLALRGSVMADCSPRRRVTSATVSELQSSFNDSRRIAAVARGKIELTSLFQIIVNMLFFTVLVVASTCVFLYMPRYLASSLDARRSTKLDNFSSHRRRRCKAGTGRQIGYCSNVVFAILHFICLLAIL